MATATTTISWDYNNNGSTAANNTAWNTLQTIGTSIVAVGLVKTADTGQIVWGTRPGLGTNGGYEMYKFADALQATQPIFIKIEYICGPSGAPIPSFYVTVGTTTDGAGNMTGTFGPRMQMIPSNTNQTDNASAAYIAAYQNVYVSGATNRLQLAICEGPNIHACYFLSVERTKDTAGVDTNEGIIVNAQLGASGFGGNTVCIPAPFISQVLPFTGTIAGYNTNWIAPVNTLGSTMTLGTVVGTSLVVSFNFRPYNPALGVLIYFTSDYALYSSNSITVYGAAHTYLALQQTFTGPTNPAGYSHVMMRYE